MSTNSKTVKMKQSPPRSALMSYGAIFHFIVKILSVILPLYDKISAPFTLFLEQARSLCYLSV